MTPIPVPHRWLAMILGIAFLLDGLLTVDAGGGIGLRVLVSLPGSALIALCAFYSLSRPVVGAVLGVVTLTLSSLAIRSAEAMVISIGLDNISLTELVAGTAITVIVVWRAAPVPAAASVAALVTGCVAAIIIRNLPGWPYYTRPGLVPAPNDNATTTAMLGLFLLIASVGAGVYLRRTGRQRTETEMGALIRKQWPLAAALAVVGLVEILQGSVVGLASGAVAGVCAFFAPKHPLRGAVVAAAAISALSVLSRLEGAGPTLSFTTIAASMALVAYAVRFLPRREAFWGTIALVVANGLAVQASLRNLTFALDMILLLLFLLGVAVATGWYFRARDRERNQTVRAAVVSAQQGERLALARELHDVVAHHVTGIVVQAQAALLVADNNPGVAVTALEKIERSGSEALTAMRTLVGGLRDGTAGFGAVGEATTDLRADLISLVEHAIGPPVSLDLDLPGQLPHEVGRSVLRLAQESLTNVGKHAPDATEVRLRVANLGDQLHIRITDDGSTRPVTPVGGSGGYGLVGMRERVELLGGRFEAGPSGYVGWSVEAWLPLSTYRGNE